MKTIAILISAIFLFGGEVRTCRINDFNLKESSFVLEDEDGYLWEFTLEDDDYAIGDEHTLHLPICSEPWIE